jgi:hypothetical protein
MLVSFAVQKWNWCGVAGFCSVATTRPIGGAGGAGSRRSITTRSSEAENRDAGCEIRDAR